MTTEMKSYPVVDTVIDMFCAWVTHARQVAEVCKLDPAEFEHIARDVGVASGDLETLVRKGIHAADELPKLLDLLGLDHKRLERSQPLALRDMECVCAMCCHKRDCDRDLAAGTAAQRYKAYCGNAPLIGVLMQKQNVH